MSEREGDFVCLLNTAIISPPQDAYETEVLDFLSKEMSIAQVFIDYVKLQASYHEQALAAINHCIPVLEGIISKCVLLG